ncbi:MAG TPA: RDD family protein [Acidisarcina sp.]
MSEVRDQLSIDTPELVAIEFPIAGIGSRFVALLVDYLIQLGVLMVLVIILAVIGKTTESGARLPENGPNQATITKWVIAIMILFPFLLQWGYFTLFEALWDGRTPGKRLAKIRVIKQTGRPIGLFESMGRNLVRIVDMIPGMYAVGMICMFMNRRQQRLGDMVAGTLVVHERALELAAMPASGNRTFTASLFEPLLPATHTRAASLPAEAVGRLRGEDLLVMEGFFSRRLDMPIDTRVSLAERLAKCIAQRMEMPQPSGLSDETFLEEAAFAMREQGRLH